MDDEGWLEEDFFSSLCPCEWTTIRCPDCAEALRVGSRLYAKSMAHHALLSRSERVNPGYYRFF